jgi:fused signal recognition particle receptor
MDPALSYVIVAAVLVVVIALLIAGRRRRPPPAVEARAETQPALKPTAPGTAAAVAPAALPPPAAPVAAPAAPAPKPLFEGLARTRSGFIARLSSLLGKKQIDAGLVAEMEEVLFTADIGARTAERLLNRVREGLSRDELGDASAVFRVIKRESREILERAQKAAPPLDVARERPFVVIAIGVNGVGKTTTIGKLAKKWRDAGKTVLLAAGDTFRAAATEQLEIWGQRVGARVVKGKEGGDPSSVIFEALRQAQAEAIDIVIADTAGRLHTKVDLMEELQKVRRVIQKAIRSAPHETLLVLDATNGQNAIAQAAMFKQTMAITGIALTKLDGTAKGGVILGICEELSVPVRFIGIGERTEDLREFDPAEFVDALYDVEGKNDVAAARSTISTKTSA